jgi:hypothetical protein
VKQTSTDCISVSGGLLGDMHKPAQENFWWWPRKANLSSQEMQSSQEKE